LTRQEKVLICSFAVYFSRPICSWASCLITIKQHVNMMTLWHFVSRPLAYISPW